MSGTGGGRSGLLRHSGVVFLLLSVALGGAVLTARGIAALGTEKVLAWDETYYASTTSTAAHGFGFYPYVQGFPPIHDMGGVGYIVSLYVLAYNLLGPHLFGLRIISFLAGLLAVAGLSVLTGRLYGSAAGFAALAFTPSILVFRLSNSIRLDVFAIAFVAWALVLYVHAAGKRDAIRWHVLVGLVFALGLEVHLHTAAAAIAVGFAYLVRAIGATRRDSTSKSRAAAPLAGFVGGYAVGAVLFVALNVLPPPQGFFRTAGLARLSATDSTTTIDPTAAMNVPKLAQSFFSPHLIVPKEITRYETMFQNMSWWELTLWLFGVPAFLLVRPAPPAFSGRVLMLGAVIGGGIVLNSSSLLYFSVILPFFIPALATGITHGIGRKALVTLADVSPLSVVILLVLTVPILPSPLSRTLQAIVRQVKPPAAQAPPAIVTAVKNAASTGCKLAGPTDLYAQYFMAYPKFVGTRQVEVSIGSTYYDLQGHITTYWHAKNPDVVFGAADVDLSAFLSEAKYAAIGQDIWKKPDNLSAGCVVTAK